MNQLKKQPASTLSRQKTKELERKKLYLALKKICEFENYKDLLLIREKPFADLCGVSQIEWNFKKGSFISRSDLGKYSLSKGASFPFRFSLPLEYRSWNWGELIFFFKQENQCWQKTIFPKNHSYFILISVFYGEQIKIGKFKISVECGL